MASVAELARTLAGIPFKHRCRNPEIGLDCAGVVIEAYRLRGFELHDFDIYGVQPNPDDLEIMLDFNGFGTVNDIRDGDVLQLFIEDLPQHVGVVDGDGFWHVEHGGTVCRARIDDWRYQIHKVWRLF